MWRLLLTFGAGVVVGAVGASYLAGVNEGRRQALQERDEENEAMDAVCANDMDEAAGNPA